MYKNTSLIIITAAALAACTQGEAPRPTAELPVRYASVDLDDIGNAEALTARCTEEEAQYRAHLAALEGFDGKPTVGGYYRSLDSLQASLQTVASTASSLAGVHPDKALRDAGDACSQLLAKVTTDMSLSRPLYDAVSAIDTADAGKWRPLSRGSRR